MADGRNRDAPQTSDWGPYIRCLADRMGLRDWTVGHDEREPKDGEGRAEVDCRYGRKILWIRFSEDFHRDKPEAQRQTICHELIHAHLAAMHQFLYDELGSRPYDTYKMLMEYGVDALADVVAPSMPLPGDVRPSRPKSRSKPRMSRPKPVRSNVVEPKPKAKAEPRGKGKGKGSK